MSRISLFPREKTSQLICVVSCVVEQVFMCHRNLCNIIGLNRVNTVPTDGKFCSYHLIWYSGVLANLKNSFRYHLPITKTSL